MRRFIITGSKIAPSLFLWLPLFCLLISSPDSLSQSRSLFHKKEVIKGDQLLEGNRYQLEGWPIIAGSEKIQIDGAEKVKDGDYKIDYRSGEVRFTAQVEPSALIVIEYDYLPISLKRTYQRQLFTPKLPSKLPEEVKPKEKPTEPSIPSTPIPSELSVSGSQTFSLSLGSGREFPPPLTQALHLNVDGKVTEKVSITALLSDQNLPIQPEGTTEEIQDLDQVLIKVTSPHFGAALGEYEAHLGSGEFIFFPRNLQGAQADVNFQKFEAGLLGAVAKGRSGSATIQGREGQNEYRIDAGGEFVIMIAGSETVWLNGERLKRGEANDYVIRDYGDPIVEFTNKHLITQNDVIRVDFEYITETQGFVQDIYGTRAETRFLEGNGSLGIAYASESDDKSKQLLPLSETEIQLLRENKLQEETGKTQVAAPQSHSTMGLNGNLNLGEHTTIIGELALSKLDSNTYSKLDKVEAGKAWKLAVNSNSSKMRIALDFRNLDARFLPVGATKASRARYKYEAQYKNTQFDDILPVSPKEAVGERELDLDLEYKPLKSFRVQGNLGRRSEKIEGERGRGGEGEKKNEINELHFTPSPLRPFAPSVFSSEESVEFVTDHWSRSISFALPELPKLDNAYQESLTSSGGVDDLKRSRDFWNFSHTVGKVNFNAQNEEIETINLDVIGNRKENNKGLSQLGANLGRRRVTRAFRVGTERFKSVSLSAERSLEESFVKESIFEVDRRPLVTSDWLKASTAVTSSLLLSASPSDWFNISSNFSNRKLRDIRRTRNIQNIGENPSESSVNLAEFRLNLLPFKRALQTDLNYQIDRKLDSVKEEIYVKVPKGQGHYRKVDDLHYEEDLTNGEYIRFVQTVGDRPVSAIEFQLRLRAQPGRLIKAEGGRRKAEEKIQNPKSKIQNPEGEIVGALLTAPDKAEGGKMNLPSIETLLNAFSLEFRWTVDEEQEGEGSRDLYFLRRLQTKDTVFGKNDFQYRITFSPGRKLEANFDYRNGSSINKRFNDRLRDLDSEEFEFDLKSALSSKISTAFEWSKNRSEERVFNIISGRNEAFVSTNASPLLISDIDQLERKGALRFRYDPSRWLSLGVGIERELARDAERLRSTALLKTLALRWELGYSIIEKGRLDMSYRFAVGKRKGELPFSRFDFYDGSSHELKSRFEYRFKRFTDIILRANYNLIISEVQKPEHRLETEVAAEF